MMTIRSLAAAVAVTLIACGGTEGTRDEVPPAAVETTTADTPTCPGVADAATDAAIPDASNDIRCGTGLTLCADARGRVCVDTQDDSAHCGFCGAACPTGHACGAGRCF